MVFYLKYLEWNTKLSSEIHAKEIDLTNKYTEKINGIINELTKTQESYDKLNSETSIKIQELSSIKQQQDKKVRSLSQQNKELLDKIQGISREYDDKLTTLRSDYEEKIQEIINDKDSYYQSQMNSITTKNQAIILKLNNEHEKQLERTKERIILIF